MKPIIIIKETNKDGKFELTEQELKELIEKAYEQGVTEGRPKATLPQNQYDRPYDGTYYREFGLGNGPKDAYGNPIPYCGGGTTSNPWDNQAVLTLTNESNDLVYRGGEHKVISPKQGEPIPCELKQQTSDSTTSLGSLPDYCSTAIGTADGAVLKGFSNQPIEDTDKGEQSR